jgi:hypothetical protein
MKFSIDTPLREVVAARTTPGRPPQPTKPVQELVEIMADRVEWRLADIHAQYKLRHPDDPKERTRAAAIRNKLQRHCASSKQYQHVFPLFENPTRGIWRLALGPHPRTD